MGIVWFLFFILTPRTTCWVAFLLNVYSDGTPRLWPQGFIEAIIVVVITQIILASDVYVWYRLLFKPYSDWLKELEGKDRPDDGCSN